jgi:hypothetical protein
LPLTEKALESIDPASFHFEDEFHHALEHFETFFPEAESIYDQLSHFDHLNPVPFVPPSHEASSPIRSYDARLIEFEETSGLREQAKRMLVRSIMVDRQRTANFYKHLGKVNEERDRLIDDLSQLNDILKRRLEKIEGSQA